MINLQEKKDKLLIDNFSLFPCFWFLKAWWNTKLEFKVVFIVLIFTKDIWKKFIKLWSNLTQLLEMELKILAKVDYLKHVFIIYNF